MTEHAMLKQVWLNKSHALDAHLISEEEYATEIHEFRESLYASCKDWPEHYFGSSNPLPVVVPKELMEHVDKLGDALCRAARSIVERWWTDTEANFPARMPLLSHQEALLRWIDGEGKHLMKPFANNMGAWRPDFLLSQTSSDAPETGHENPKFDVNQVQICEINARFAFNAFMGAAFSHEAFEKKGLENLGLRSATDPEKIFAAFKSLLRPGESLHLIKGTESGLDIFLFKYYLEIRCGMSVRIVGPQDLRLVRDTDSNRDLVYCRHSSHTPIPVEDSAVPKKYLFRNGELLEHISQAALELHQRELQSMGDNMLKALAPICFNDFRAIFLVHDKRMLGIVQQELRSLVEVHKVITASEAKILCRGTIPTILPGTLELRKLTEKIKIGLASKDDYLLKLVSSGKGKGIIFGSDLARKEDFVAELQRLSNPQIEERNYVVQPVVTQESYDAIGPVNDRKSEIMHHPFVGTFMMINGQQLGLAGWKTGPGRVCAVSAGATWICSVVQSLPGLETCAPNCSTLNLISSVVKKDNKETRDAKEPRRKFGISREQSAVEFGAMLIAATRKEFIRLARYCGF